MSLFIKKETGNPTEKGPEEQWAASRWWNNCFNTFFSPFYITFFISCHPTHTHTHLVFRHCANFGV